MKFKGIILFFIGFSVSANLLLGQSRTELENQRKESLKQLELTNQLLKETELSKKSNLQKVLIYNQRINLRESIISGITKEINILDERIKERETILNGLTNDLIKAREEYAKIIYYAFKYRNSYNKFLYILAAEDINQAYRRLKYFQQISQFRKKQIKVINDLSLKIKEKLIELQSEKGSKISLLRTQRDETVALNKERNKSNAEVLLLSKREKELRQEIKKQQRIAQQLENAIKDLIAEEAKKAAAKKEVGLTPSDKIISDNFRSNKGGLPWPTEKGVIVAFFGEMPHPVLKGIKVQNNGIDILTTEGALVRSIFKGEVRKVINIPGMNKGVIVRHGNFLTVYTNLSDVYVKAGDIVETKSSIGKIYTDKTDGNKTVLHLEIWEENNKQDPILWISR